MTINKKIVKRMVKIVSYSKGFEGKDLIGLKAYYDVEENSGSMKH